jgi:hypothetical protein
MRRQKGETQTQMNTDEHRYSTWGILATGTIIISMATWLGNRIGERIHVHPCSSVFAFGGHLS